MKSYWSIFVLIISMGFSTATLGNGPTIGLDEELNPQIQQQQQHDIPKAQEATSSTQYDMVRLMDQDTVTELQEKLLERGFSPGPIDGLWGPKTERALRKWQAKAGFIPTGQINQKTLSALNIQPPAEPQSAQKEAQAQEEEKARE